MKKEFLIILISLLLFIFHLSFAYDINEETKKINFIISNLIQEKTMKILFEEMEVNNPKFQISQHSRPSIVGSVIGDLKYAKYVIDTSKFNSQLEMYNAMCEFDLKRIENYNTISLEVKEMSYYDEQSIFTCDYDIINDSLYQVSFIIKESMIPSKYQQNYFKNGYLVLHGVSYIVLCDKKKFIILDEITMQ